MAEPVVHLELEPGAGEDVDDRRRLELLAREQPRADEARARLEQPGQRLRVGAVERDVAAEAGADHPHRRAVEVVVAPVGGARVLRPPSGPPSRAAGAGVVEVLLAQARAQADEREHAERPRQPVPAEAAVERPGRRGQQLREPEGQATSSPARRMRPDEKARPMKTSARRHPRQPSQRRRLGAGVGVSPSSRAASSRSSASSVVTSSRLELLERGSLEARQP